jgi:uncharacterized protein
LIGHSLGGIFLAKYLSENNLSQKILALFLIAAPYDSNSKYSLGDFILPVSLELLKKQVKNVFLYYSYDDVVVPFTALEEYIKIFANATQRIFKDQGHFQVPIIPGLVEDIKKVSS